MKMRRLITAVVAAAMLVFVSPAMAEEKYDAGLQVNNSAVEFLAGAELPATPGQLRVDVNALFEEDDYKMLGAALTIGDTVITPGLTGRLGFRALAGNFERPGKDSDLYSAAFFLKAEYDLSEAYVSQYIPVILHAGVSFGPSPLCFEDTDEYREYTAGIEWWVIENAALMLSFRHIDARFDDPVKWDETDNDAYGGIKIKF